MSVGVPAIDSDHKCLIRIIDLLDEIHDQEDSQRMIDTVLDTLLVYSRHHFAREERVLAACRFPGRAFHHSEHQGFAQHIQSLRKRFSGKGDLKMASELLDYLVGWLRHHILIQDMAFKPYVAGKPRAEQVARLSGPNLLDMADDAGMRLG
jgi:hemerythrin-like metal-binding protein